MFKFFKMLCTTDGEKLRGGADSRHSVSKRKIRYMLCSKSVTWVVKFQPAAGLKGKTMYKQFTAYHMLSRRTNSEIFQPTRLIWCFRENML